MEHSPIKCGFGVPESEMSEHDRNLIREQRKLLIEKTKLERAVIDAAKAHAHSDAVEDYTALLRAVELLEAFEKGHKK